MNDCLLVILLLALPLAGATGTLDVGPVSVDLSNGQTEDCIEHKTELCIASRTGDSPGETWINAEQRFEHLWVQVDDSDAEEATGYELLPDGALLVVDSNTVTPEHPIFILLTQYVGTVRAPADAIVIIFEKDEFGVQFQRPNRTEDGVVIERWDGLSGPYSEDGGLEYHRLGPLLSGGAMWNTDAWVASDIQDVCTALREAFCHDEDAAFVAAAAREALPTVVVAFEIKETGVGVGPVDSSDPQGPLTRDRIDAPLHRVQMSVPFPLRDHASRPGPFGVRGTGPQLGPEPSGAPAPRAPPFSLANADARPQKTPPLPFPLEAVAIAVAGLAFVLIATALLYSRIRSREAALQHPARRRILEIIESHGPQTVAEIARLLSIDRTSVQHHADVLRRTGQASITREGRHSFLSLPGQTVNASPAPKSPTQALVVALLEDAGGVLSRGALVEHTAGVPARTRNHALLTLLKEGRVIVVKEGDSESVRLVAQASSA